MAELKYDTARIRSAADQLKKDADSFESIKQSIDDLVKKMSTYFEDSVNTTYVSKYNRDAEPSAKSVHTLLINFSNSMRGVAEAVEEGIKKGNANLNGN